MQEGKVKEMLAYEAFLRRAAMVDMPFMLKGSYVTRQYFPKPEDRVPGDMDWVYTKYIADEATARTIFNNWAQTVTELEINDGVRFRSFNENKFWRMMDYAMADDFPTVNTDLVCWIGDEEVDISIDVSFNLDLEYGSVPITYKPIQGDVFVVPHTVPLNLQVAWKIHQTLVRPRYKDLFDLIYLVKHPRFTPQVLADTMHALVKECRAGNVDLRLLYAFLNFEITVLLGGNEVKYGWDYWRHQLGENAWQYGIGYERVDHITDADSLPETLKEFLAEFKTAMANAGFGPHLMEGVVGFEKPSTSEYEAFLRSKNTKPKAPVFKVPDDVIVGSSSSSNDETSSSSSKGCLLACMVASLVIGLKLLTHFFK